MEPGAFIETEQELDRALQYWKNVTFKGSPIKLDDAVRTLNTEGRLVGAYNPYAPRWVLVKRGTKQAAIFYTVGIWRWNSHIETGNFVPVGKPVPERLPEDRIQTTPNNMCQISYAFDTSKDKSLWTAQRAFEEFVQKEPGWNSHTKARRGWQSGDNGNDNMFIMTAQIFRRRTPYTKGKEQVSYRVHEWIAEATPKESDYFPNPDRPKMLEPVGNVLRDIGHSSAPYLRIGDLVWVSFFVEFFIGGSHWSSHAVPRQFVRVGKVSTELLTAVRGGGDLEFDDSDCLDDGDAILLAPDFPMSDVTAAPSSRSNPSDTAVAPQGSQSSQSAPANEVAFGPGDADFYRNIRQFERDCLAAEQASSSQSAKGQPVGEGDGVEDADGSGEGDSEEVADDQRDAVPVHGKGKGVYRGPASSAAAKSLITVREITPPPSTASDVSAMRATEHPQAERSVTKAELPIDGPSLVTIPVDEPMTQDTPVTPPPSPARDSQSKTGTNASPVQVTIIPPVVEGDGANTQSAPVEVTISIRSPSKKDAKKRRASPEHPARGTDTTDGRVLRERRPSAKARLQ